MVIAGLQKLTLLDYPGRTACTVFLGGCNFRCPFCHNSGILSPDAPPAMDRGELLAFLKKRRGLLDAVCVSGGEPTLHPDLLPLLREIKGLGYLVKLDTNGSRPEVLRRAAAEGLLDYAAMDIKNSPERYGETAGVKNLDLAPIRESMAFLLTGDLDYEFRTTVAEGLHSEADFAAMGALARELAPDRPVSRWFLQPFEGRDTVLRPGLRPPKGEELARYAAILAPFARLVSIRGELGG